MVTVWGKPLCQVHTKPACQPPIRVGERVWNVDMLALAYRQIPQHRSNKPMPGIEGRQASLAPPAVAVLRKQRVLALDADAARLINGFRIGIRRENCKAGAEALG